MTDVICESCYTRVLDSICGGCGRFVCKSCLNTEHDVCANCVKAGKEKETEWDGQ